MRRGLGVLTTDAFKDRKIKMAEISEKTKNNLRKFLPEESSVSNPIDLLGDADEKRYGKTLNMLKKEDVGSILCLLTPQDQTPVKKIAGKLLNSKKNPPAGGCKSIVTVFMGGERVKKAVDKLRESDMPNYFLAQRSGERIG